jgi:hypothetical protein
MYLGPVATKIVPISTATLMHMVGAVEIVAGLIVLSRWTKIGSLVAILARQTRIEIEGIQAALQWLSEPNSILEGIANDTAPTFNRFSTSTLLARAGRRCICGDERIERPGVRVAFLGQTG